MFKQLTNPKLRIGAVALAFWAVINSTASVDARPVLSPGCAPAGPVVYSNDFEGTVGPEWSSTSVDTTPSSRRFLGQLGNDALTLTLPCLPAHVQVTLSFDLYVIRSWDGNIITQPVSGGKIGPDVWGVRDAGGSVLLETTFTNWLDFRQAYPGPYPGSDNAPLTGVAETNSLGYLYADRPMDAVYHLGFSFPHSTDSLTLDFYASGLQALTDESWGIDNVRIGVVSPYLYLPLIASNYSVATPAPPTGTPSSTPAPTGTPTRTPSLTPSSTRTPTNTQTHTPASSQTPSATPTSTSTATRTSTPTPTKTSTLTNTATSTHTSTATGTNTPPDTPSHTPTATANCANYSLSAASQTTSSGFPRVNFSINNSDAQNTWIQAITFTWAAYDGANPGQTLNGWRYDGNNIDNMDDTGSPTTWTNGGTLGTLDDLNIGETDTFNFDYLNADAGWPGIVPASSFGLTVTLGNGCVVSVSALPTPTPSQTPSPVPSFTLTPSATSSPLPPTSATTPAATPTRTRSPTPTGSPTRTPTVVPFVCPYPPDSPNYYLCFLTPPPATWPP